MVRRSLLTSVGACALLLLTALPVSAQQPQCTDLNGRVHANLAQCVTFSSLADDGQTSVGGGFWINFQSFGWTKRLLLPEQTGNPNGPLEYGVHPLQQAPPGYRFKQWDITGPITVRYIPQPAPAGFVGICVNCWAFRIKGGGTIVARWEKMTPPIPPPGTPTGQLLPRDGSDCAGQAGQSIPNDTADVRVRLQGVPAKPIKQVTVTGQGSNRWAAPVAGNVWPICVVRQSTVVDLYFEPAQSTTYSVVVLYQDNTTHTVAVR